MIKKVIIILLVTYVSVVACRNDDELTPGSNIDLKRVTARGIDSFITENFVDPYNIEIVYEWQESLFDLPRYLFPPTIDSVMPALEILETVWITPYTSVGGEDFIKSIAPRQIILSGGVNRNPSGTRTLGVAEAGKRVTLFEIDLLNKSSRSAISRFMETLQHEYAHILNQRFPFDEETYGNITPEGYTGQWFNESDRGSREEGFISAYARSAPTEDFAEMVATMLTRSRTDWDNLIDGIASDEAKEDIRTKEQIVSAYYQDVFSIDVYVLQDSIYRRTGDVIR